MRTAAALALAVAGALQPACGAPPAGPSRVSSASGPAAPGEALSPRIPRSAWVPSGLLQAGDGVLVVAGADLAAGEGWVEGRSPGLGILWRAATGHVFNPPAPAGPGRVAVPNLHDREFTILDAATGRRVGGAAWGGDPPRAWATAPDGSVLLSPVGTANLRRVEPSGSILWERTLAPEGRIERAPVVAPDGRIGVGMVSGEDARIVLLAPDGSELAAARFPDRARRRIAYPAGFGADGILTGYFLAEAGRSEIVFVAPSGPAPAPLANVRVDSNLLVLPGGDLVFVSGSGLLRLRRNGSIAWTAPALPQATQVTPAGGAIVWAETGRIRAIEEGTGHPLWTVEEPGIEPETPFLVLSDGSLLVAPTGGDLVRRPLPSPPRASPGNP